MLHQRLRELHRIWFYDSEMEPIWICYSDREWSLPFADSRLDWFPRLSVVVETGLEPVYTKRQHQRCDNSAMTLAILFSLIENNGVTPRAKWVLSTCQRRGVLSRRGVSIQGGVYLCNTKFGAKCTLQQLSCLSRGGVTVQSGSLSMG